MYGYKDGASLRTATKMNCLLHVCYIPSEIFRHDKTQFTLIIIHVTELFFHEQWGIASYGIPSLARSQSNTVTATSKDFEGSNSVLNHYCRSNSSSSSSSSSNNSGSSSSGGSSSIGSGSSSNSGGSSSSCSSSSNSSSSSSSSGNSGGGSSSCSSSSSSSGNRGGGSSSGGSSGGGGGGGGGLDTVTKRKSLASCRYRKRFLSLQAVFSVVKSIKKATYFWTEDQILNHSVEPDSLCSQLTRLYYSEHLLECTRWRISTLTRHKVYMSDLHGSRDNQSKLQGLYGSMRS